MIGDLRRSVLQHLVSPYGMALVPCCLFLFAWLFPPRLYTRYVLEPDLMHLNMMVLIFFMLCVAAFLAGVRVMVGFTSPRPTESQLELQLRARSTLFYLMLPLSLAGVSCFVYLLLLGRNIDFLALLLSQRGGVMKQAITGGNAAGYWGSTLFLLTGVLWWSAYRFGQLQLRGRSRALFYAVFFGCFAVDLATCLATFDRTNLMPLLAGLVLIDLFFKTRARSVRLARIVISGFAAFLAIVGAFIALQFARSATRLDSMIASLLGYTVVSYNRLAAMMLGVTHYLYQGKGAYLIAFLTENERFHAVRAQMGLPSSYQIWLSEFPVLRASGLNPAYNWAGVFGYVYSDIGWWTPIYLFATGLLAGLLCSRFRAGTTFGIVLYPWMAFWILFWFGWNLLLDARGVVLIETSLLLFVYDKLSLVPIPRTHSATLSKSSWEPLQQVTGPSREGLR